MITQAELHYLFDLDKDTGTLHWKVKPSIGVNIGDVAGSPNGDDYILIKIKNRKYKRSRLIFLYAHGWLPKKLDHRNRIRTDDHLDNLRPATSSQNMRNRRGFSKTGLPKGAYKHGRRYQSAIWLEGRWRCLGTFDTPEEASKRYFETATKHFGEFASNGRD